MDTAVDNDEDVGKRIKIFTKTSFSPYRCICGMNGNSSKEDYVEKSDDDMVDYSVTGKELSLIAALISNKERFKSLLRTERLDAKYSGGDTICHSIIRYAHAYPDKVKDVLNMCRMIDATSFNQRSDSSVTHDEKKEHATNQPGESTVRKDDARQTDTKENTIKQENETQSTNDDIGNSSKTQIESLQITPPEASSSGPNQTKFDDDMVPVIADTQSKSDTRNVMEHNKKLRKKIWKVKNNDGMTPLQMATLHGLHEIFAFIMNTENYRMVNKDDGLFDVYVYDITEIDAISSISKTELEGSTAPEKAESKFKAASENAESISKTETEKAKGISKEALGNAERIPDDINVNVETKALHTKMENDTYMDKPLHEPFSNDNKNCEGEGSCNRVKEEVIQKTYYTNTRTLKTTERKSLKITGSNPDVLPYGRSVLMMLLEIDPSKAVYFLTVPAVRRVLQEKWKEYKRVFYGVALFHFVFICFLTWYATERTQILPYNVTQTPDEFDVKAEPRFKYRIPHDLRVTILGSVNLVVAIFHIATEIVRMTKHKMTWTKMSLLNPYSNGWFRIAFLVFSGCLIIDFCAAFGVGNKYETIFLTIASLLGWFLMIFFLRALPRFSFFTVLIQELIVGEFLWFSVILLLEIVGFSTALYMSIQGSPVLDDIEYSSFWRVVLSMFKLLLGIGDVAAVHETRRPIVCILIFIGFMFMTSLLMLKALIAIINHTVCERFGPTDSLSSYDGHCELQRLAIILYIESILPDGWVHKCGQCVLKRKRQNSRYHLELTALKPHDLDDYQSTQEVRKPTIISKTAQLCIHSPHGRNNTKFDPKLVVLGH